MSATDHTPYLHLPIWVEGNITDWFELNSAFTTVDNFAKTVDSVIMNKQITVDSLNTNISTSIKAMFRINNPDRLTGIVFICGHGSASQSLEVRAYEAGISIYMANPTRNFVIPIFLRANEKLIVNMSVVDSGGATFIVDNYYFLKFLLER